MYIYIYINLYFESELIETSFHQNYRGVAASQLLKIIRVEGLSAPIGHCRLENVFRYFIAATR